MTFNFGETFNINGANGDKSGLTFFNDTFWINKPSTPTPGWKDVTVTGEDTLNLPNAKADGLNYLKAYGKCYQGNLPYGYTQLESISGIANKAWFGTGVAGNNDNLRFVFTGYKDKGVAYTSFFANYIDESSNVTRLIAFTASSGIIAEVNRRSASSVITNSTNYLVAHTYELYKENDVSILKVDGAQVDAMAAASGTANSTNIAINASKINPSTPSSDVVTTFKGIFQIYDGTTLIRNYVMAKRDSDNAVGMYDTVNNTFKISEGTENFTAGADLKPLPTYPLAITCNNGTIKVRSKSGLPDGYVKLKYLESSGTQYIDIGISGECKVTIDCQGSAAASASKIVVGSYTSAPSFFGAYSSTNKWGMSSSFYGLLTNIDYTTRATFELYFSDNAYIKVNDTTYTCEGTTPIYTSATYALFRAKAAASGNYYYANAKIYSCTFEQNNTLVRNLIPAKRISDNELGMYDLVSNTFLTNAGTGTFTGGGIDEDDLEIYIDGTTETIEIHGKNLFDYSSIGTIKPDPSGTTEREGIIIKGLKAGTYTFSCKSNKSFTINYVRIANGVRIDGSPAPAITRSPFQITLTGEMDEIRFWVAMTTATSWRDVSDVQLEQGSTATTYEPYFNGGIATCQNLLSAGTYKDVQSILDGTVTRNIGVKVLTGDEDWAASSTANLYSLDGLNNYDSANFQNGVVFCTHFIGVLPTTSGADMPNYSLRAGGASGAAVAIRRTIYIKYAGFSSVNDFKQWLADQYANGTPVIVIYPLTTATTETVTAQTLTTKRGDNTIEITQASLGDLTLEAEYQAGVTVTIEEVEEANLDNNVTVVIGE